MSTLPDSALKYLLLALVPYTEANLKLVYTPNRFFNDLDKIDAKKRYTRRHWQNTYYKAKKAGLIDYRGDKTPYLTGRGQALLELYTPKQLENSELMVIFDIPEKFNSKRQAFRRVLKQLEFTQVQKSVWTTKFDCKNYLKTEINWLNIGEFVQIYEVVKLK